MNDAGPIADAATDNAGGHPSSPVDRVFVKKRFQKYLLPLLDLAAIHVAYILSLRLHMFADSDLGTSPFSVPAFLILFAFACTIVLIFQSQGLYKINVYTGILGQGQRVLKSLLIAVLGFALLRFFTKSQAIVESRFVLISFLVIGFALLVLLRIVIFRSAVLFVASRGWFPRRVIVAGTGKSAMKLVRGVGHDNRFGLEIVGFLSDEIDSGTTVLGSLAVLGRVSDVADIVRRERIHEVIFALEGQPDSYTIEMLERAIRSRAQILVASSQFGVIAKRVHVESYGGVPLFSVGANRGYMGIPGLKRLLDVLGAIVGLVILAPLFLVLVIAIKLDSRGPVLYRQSRIGLKGHLFTFFKFRSMYTGSDRDPARVEKLKLFIREEIADSAVDTKIVASHLVTRVGRFIRKLSFDELPQLINVLRGDMSLVGPRPCLPYEWEHYAEWHKRRLDVMPGCTGLWQVLGRSEVGFRDMVIMDLYYSYNITFHLDVNLIVKTLPVMLFGSGGR